ncbi:MAG: serine/threonine transporter SstT [Bacteroidales bacterium]|nr:serine/threonine transporter SstT [Bacteroidales bacterium]MBQ2162542.1 serine/threonine transporter SstT [Bacteroidales bacterium]MBQ2544038.1 serine/threonine transporter SstT [Bacteroidales bacterium]MBQ3942390.1 serine/threonine transporter SstT [Bacteroidales bacterium]MBQ4026638.1 serine/threonine transporter SstT [Bacteroidales bacterium]
MGKVLKWWTGTSLVLRILCGLVIGAVLGLIVPQWTGIGILGHIFVSALKAIAPVLVAFLVASSIAKAQGGLGPRFRTVIVLYLTATLVAAAVAVIGSFLFPVTLSLGEVAEGSAPGALTDVFKNLLSKMVMNPLEAIATANYIGILFWAIILGLGLKLAASEGTIKVISEFADVITLAVKWIIQFAPFGILGLVFSAVSESGLEIFTTYGKLLALLVSCMLVSVLLFNPLISFIATGRNPFPLLFTCLKESGLNAFFTRSSAANIPINMDLCRRLGLEEDFYSVSIPLGATVNMNGAAVTITVMTLAVAHTVGVEVSFASALLLSVIATLGACGASGVAGGSLLLIPMACSFFGISNDIAMQAVAIGFIIGVVQDSVETAANSSGDVFFTATAEYRARRKPLGFFGKKD